MHKAYTEKLCYRCQRPFMPTGPRSRYCARPDCHAVAEALPAVPAAEAEVETLRLLSAARRDRRPRAGDGHGDVDTLAPQRCHCGAVYRVVGDELVCPREAAAAIAS